MEDDEIKKQPKFEIGQNLEEMSIDELNETVDLLSEEIKRLQTAALLKTDHLSAAEALFAKK